MEVTMLLWLYSISAFYSAVILRRQKGAAKPRAMVSILAVGGISALGVLMPETAWFSFPVGTAGFVVFLLLPGLLVRLGRHFAGRGAFGAAALSLGGAYLLFPAAGFSSERDLYRGIRDHGGAAHPAAPEIQRRLKALSGGPTLRLAPATTALMAVILCAFALMTLFGDSTSLLTLLEFGANHAPLVKAGEVHRLFTAMLLHAGWLHLIFNVGALWVLGRWLEPDLGAGRTLIVFLLSGVLGNVASLVLYWSEPVVAAGASGGAMGMIGCTTMLLLDPAGAEHRARRLPSLLLIIGATVLIGAFVPGIDNGAHVGGLVAGALLGLVFTRVSRLPNRVMTATAGALVALTLASMVAVGLQLPGWRGSVVQSAPEFTIERPARSQVVEDDGPMRIEWFLIGSVEIEILDPPPADPQPTVRERLGGATDGPPPKIESLHGAVRGFFGRKRIEGPEGAQDLEVYVLTDREDSHAAVLTFHLPADDPVIRERFLTRIVTSFGFR
jgi:membrane associated rhomboid family serine protease